MSSGGTASPSPAAGWYPDPLDPTIERLWDGDRWSEQTRPGRAGGTPSPPPLGPPTPGDPSFARSKRDGSGAGWSTGSIIGIGCGLLALLSVGGCVVLVGVVPLMAVRSQQGFVEEEFEVAVEMTMTTVGPPAIPPEPMEEFAPATVGADVAPFGSSAEMVAVLDNGEAAAFDVTVEESVDVTEPVLAAGGPGLEPEEDRVLVGVAATVTLRESTVESLPASGLFQWTIVGGATGTRYPPVVASSVGCDLIDEDLTVDEFGIGDERRGIVCFLVPSADVEHPETHVLLEVTGGAPITWIR